MCSQALGDAPSEGHWASTLSVRTGTVVVSQHEGRVRDSVFLCLSPMGSFYTCMIHTQLPFSIPLINNIVLTLRLPAAQVTIHQNEGNRLVRWVPKPDKGRLHTRLAETALSRNLVQTTIHRHNHHRVSFHVWLTLPTSPFRPDASRLSIYHMGIQVQVGLMGVLHSLTRSFTFSASSAHAHCCHSTFTGTIT